MDVSRMVNRAVDKAIAEALKIREIAGWTAMPTVVLFGDKPLKRRVQVVENGAVVWYKDIQGFLP